VIYDVIVTELA